MGNEWMGQALGGRLGLGRWGVVVLDVEPAGGFGGLLGQVGELLGHAKDAEIVVTLFSLGAKHCGVEGDREHVVVAIGEDRDLAHDGGEHGWRKVVDPLDEAKKDDVAA
ncbi:MAG: hypothetical protein AAFX99_17850 [Myxococcota bacterium]